MNEWIILIVLSFIAGCTVKYADFLEDSVKSRKAIRIFFGVLYGCTLFMGTYLFPLITTLWIGVILGLLLIGKIDGPAHYTGVGTFFILGFSIGFSSVSWTLLLIYVIANIIEEIVNEYTDKHKIKQKWVQKITQSRPILELTVLTVAISTGIWIPWIALFSFDIGYILITRYEMEAT